MHTKEEAHMEELGAQVAIVTGTTGIGRAIVNRLAVGRYPARPGAGGLL